MLSYLEIVLLLYLRESSNSSNPCRLQNSRSYQNRHPASFFLIARSKGKEWDSPHESHPLSRAKSIREAFYPLRQRRIDLSKDPERQTNSRVYKSTLHVRKYITRKQKQ
jgi:hypothetical protein